MNVLFDKLSPTTKLFFLGSILASIVIYNEQPCIKEECRYTSLSTILLTLRNATQIYITEFNIINELFFKILLFKPKFRSKRQPNQTHLNSNESYFIIFILYTNFVFTFSCIPELHGRSDKIVSLSVQRSLTNGHCLLSCQPVFGASEHRTGIYNPMYLSVLPCLLAGRPCRVPNGRRWMVPLVPPCHALYIRFTGRYLPTRS